MSKNDGSNNVIALIVAIAGLAVPISLLIQPESPYYYVALIALAAIVVAIAAKIIIIVLKPPKYNYKIITINNIKDLEEYLDDGWNIMMSLDNKLLLRKRK